MRKVRIFHKNRPDPGRLDVILFFSTESAHRFLHLLQVGVSVNPLIGDLTDLPHQLHPGCRVNTCAVQH